MENELKFIELRAKGWSYDRISKEIGVSKPTLIKWSRTHAMEIQNQCQLEMEAFRENLKLDRRSRYAVLAAVLEKLEVRIAKANFDDLPLDKALTALLKYSDMFPTHSGDVTFVGEYDLLSHKHKTKWTG